MNSYKGSYKVPLDLRRTYESLADESDIDKTVKIDSEWPQVFSYKVAALVVLFSILIVILFRRWRERVENNGARHYVTHRIPSDRLDLPVENNGARHYVTHRIPRDRLDLPAHPDSNESSVAWSDLETVTSSITLCGSYDTPHFRWRESFCIPSTPSRHSSLYSNMSCQSHDQENYMARVCRTFSQESLIRSNSSSHCSSFNFSNLTIRPEDSTSQGSPEVSARSSHSTSSSRPQEVTQPKYLTRFQERQMNSSNSIAQPQTIRSYASEHTVVTQPRYMTRLQTRLLSASQSALAYNAGNPTTPEQRRTRCDVRRSHSCPSFVGR